MDVFNTLVKTMQASITEFEMKGIDQFHANIKKELDRKSSCGHADGERINCLYSQGHQCPKYDRLVDEVVLTIC
jgi:hypothetical protein